MKTYISSTAMMVVIMVCFVCSASGQYVNKSSVLDGSGITSVGGTLTNISAAGQPGGIAESEGGGYVNQAGFLNTFAMKPDLDTDSDGIIDELDRDNDNDGLADRVEVEGSSFSPYTPTLVNVADTDSDGIPDGFEASSGTDPEDDEALLTLVAISNAPLGRGIAWLARGNNEKTYVVRAYEDIDIMNAAVVFSNTVAGGSAPWYAITTSVTSAYATNYQYFAVEVVP